MDKQTKDDVKNSALIATGTLSLIALLESMSESKTLVIVLMVILSIFAGIALLVSHYAGV